MTHINECTVANIVYKMCNVVCFFHLLHFSALSSLPYTIWFWLCDIVLLSMNWWRERDGVNIFYCCCCSIACDIRFFYSVVSLCSFFLLVLLFGCVFVCATLLPVLHTVAVKCGIMEIIWIGKSHKHCAFTM